MLRLLLENGASANTLDANSRSALHHAVDNPGCTPLLVELLLDHGGLVSTADERNMTPLHYSVKHHNRSVARMLLDRGVCINSGVFREKRARQNGEYGSGPEECAIGFQQISSQQAATGLTPLHYASLVGDLEMTEFLLEHRADPNALSENGESPLRLALRRRVEERIWDDVSKQEELRKDDWDGFHESTKDRDKVLHALLSDPRIILTAKDCKESSLLHCISYGKPESSKILQRLVSNGADPISDDSIGKIPLHFASNVGDYDSVMVLLSLGADVASTDYYDRNALHYAARSAHHQTIAAILDTERAKSVNLAASKDSDGKNALSYLLSARSRAQIETVQLLLDRGLDCSERDDEGNLPLSSYLDVWINDMSGYSYKDMEEDIDGNIRQLLMERELMTSVSGI